MRQYQDLIKEVLRRGEIQFDKRTELYVLSIPSWRTSYDTREGLPLVTTKKVVHRLPFEEVLWKLRGETTVKSLFDRGIHIWDGNAFDYWVKKNGLNDKYPKNTPAWDRGFAEFCERIRSGEEEGSLGKVYGGQWRNWRNEKGERTDQLTDLFVNIENNPGSRYHLLNALNSGEFKDMAIAPCPAVHQFNIYDRNIDLSVGQRSCDVLLGIPFNDAQDTLLLAMVAKKFGLNPRNLERLLFNTHLYAGVEERAKFWFDDDNVDDFRKRLEAAKKPEDYMDLKDWYLSRVNPEPAGSERKDHIPFALEQLSKEPRVLPRLVLEDIPFMDAIHKPAKEVAKVIGYNPHVWDSKAAMAA
jgi:thymidylate synthase